MCANLIKRCASNFDSYGKDLKLLSVQWMESFQKYNDDLMETAVILCISSLKKFPMISNIKDAIKELAYDEQSKPKQLSWDVKRTSSLHQKIMDMATGKTDTKDYLSKADITEMRKYSKVFFPDISDESILKNYPEFDSGMESQAMCFACRTDPSVCITKGYQIRHRMESNGYIKNEMAKCQK